MSKSVPLTHGQFAIVDDEDFDKVSRYEWWEAWWSKTTGSYYARTRPRVDGTQITIYMHRLVLGLNKGDKRQGDHIRSGETLDNRRSVNLRICARSNLNQMNARKRKGTRFPFKGVSSSNGNRFKAIVKINQINVSAGSSSDIRIAAAYYDRLALKLHGEFALTNRTLGLLPADFPEPPPARLSRRTREKMRALGIEP